MVGKKLGLIFGVLALSLVLIGFAGACLCGDGIKQSWEECDNGSLNGNLCWASYGSSCTYCSSICELKIITNYCGDGIKQSCEECDDGNNVDGDGCSSICKIEESCDDVAVRYSYDNSFGTGIAVRPESGEWIPDTPANLTEGNYEIKFFIDNKKSESADDVNIKLMIDGIVLEDYITSIDCHESKSVIFNSSDYCGSHIIYLEAVKEGNECDLSDNYAQREIYVECQEIPEPYCGDGIVNQVWEECDGESDCTSECKWEEDDEEKGHGNILSYEECLSNWKCSGWSECSDGVMTRNCVDNNNCEYSINEPYTTSDCVDSVIKKSKVENNSNNIWFFLGVILFVVLLIVLVNLKD